jgi:hypothetical protein
MTSSVRDIRVGLRRRLETISELRAYDVWPTTINPPVAVVRPLSGSYHEDEGGSVTHQFEITLLLQLGHLQSVQEDLDAYLATEGPASIPCALEADPSLGGCAHSATVMGWRDYGTMRVGADEDGRAPEFIGVRFDVEVLA